MNSLEECGHGIWGAPESLERLKAAQSARLLLVSDTHGRASVLRAILKGYGRSCDALLFAGDGLADIIECREEAIASPETRELLPQAIAVVAGNCDEPACRVASEKNPSARVFFRAPLLQALPVCGKQILLAHGHLLSVNSSLETLAGVARANGCQIAVYGHTHIAAAKGCNSVFAINPGSPSLPRGGSAASFAILEVKAGSAPPAYSFYEVSGGAPL